VKRKSAYVVKKQPSVKLDAVPAHIRIVRNRLKSRALPHAWIDH
jgi:hypothetical protein